MPSTVKTSTAKRPASAPVLIRDATLWPATGKTLRGDLLMRDGRIVAMGKGLKAPAGVTTIDAKGRIVTPGLVDMHSHIGVYASPSAMANADGNEISDALLPMVRAIDAFDPEDPAIARAVTGGVTTSLILPGSANIMGGEALYVKMRGRTVAEMAIADAPRSMKMAMGENPKRLHGRKGRQPKSRLGHGWLMRKRLSEARALIDKQARWDGGRTGDKPRPADLGLEPLTALLRGQVLLHVHCYQVHDIETLLRIANEFGFKVRALHHALEAWKVPSLLKKDDVAVATFADLWGFKMEAYDASVRAPAILHKAGVKVALKSDHPVLDARELAWEAARAHHYGLPAQAALAAITRVPAEVIGLGHRVGTLAVGKDADIVLWGANPLHLGARPVRVWIDGVQVVGP